MKQSSVQSGAGTAGIKNLFGLYAKECKKVICSLTFLLYTAAIFAMYYTQFHSELSGAETEPKPGFASYGMTEREVPEILMPRALDQLMLEYLQNSYTAYPIGFYKEVHLVEKKRQKMADIICELTGQTRAELNNQEDENDGFEEDGAFRFEVGGEDGIWASDDNSFVVGGDRNPVEKESSHLEYSLSETITYERFRELMREADKLIGGGSRYSDKYIVFNFSQVPKTYEEALEEYRQLVDEDKITGGYARLYCDYVGFMLGVLPVFVAVSLMQLDRKARMEQLVYSRRISSAKLIFSRYAALVTAMFLPIIITAAMAQAKVIGFYPDAKMDMFAFARYTVLWMLPTLMAVSAVGMLLTELASGLIAILLQGAWWFTGMFSSALTGDIGKFNLTIRHNSLYKLDTFQEQYGDFLFNRAFYTVLAILLAALTAVIYEQKRRGRNFGLYTLVKNHKSKSAA